MKITITSAGMLLLVAALGLSAPCLGVAPSFAAIRPLPERNLSREQILERLVDAETTLHSWNIAGAKTRLNTLVTELATDNTPFNSAVKKKASEIVADIDGSKLRDADTHLGVLIKAVRDGVMPAFADQDDNAAL